jgi:hypothetical protein
MAETVGLWTPGGADSIAPGQGTSHAASLFRLHGQYSDYKLRVSSLEPPICRYGIGSTRIPLNPL